MVLAGTPPEITVEIDPVEAPLQVTLEGVMVLAASTVALLNVKLAALVAPCPTN